MEMKRFAERLVKLLYGYSHNVEVLDFSYVCKFAYASVEDSRTHDKWYILYEVVFPDDGQTAPFIHLLQTYQLEQSARIAFVALTDFD